MPYVPRLHLHSVGFSELIMPLRSEQKLAIREYVQELGVPHTFIDVGWWMQLYLPLPLRSRAPLPFKEMTWKIFDDGHARNLLTHLDNIGLYVARIIADPRTLNKAVIVWEDEVKVNAAHDVGEHVSGDGDALKAKRIHVSALFCQCSARFP